MSRRAVSQGAPQTSQSGVAVRARLAGAIERSGMWGDLRDYELMALREREKHNSRMHAWECWELHRRRWFPSKWGLS